MPELEPTAADPETSTPPRHRLPRRILLAITLLVLLLLAALLPPYINVNRLQRRIVTSISSSLGRPVHLDNITLNLLPLPSFTLRNFVVDEDPAFGAEPIIRAGSVTASLRASSLWRRRVEFSTISFENPSVNLVHNPDGKWNLESILLQASRVSSAPTADKHPGPAPRFPYIEATGARINLKLGQEKTPFSLTDTNFALWQPDPSQWRFRLKGTPARTDTDVSDTGRLDLEATLGRAPNLRDVPLTLHAAWRSPPLGQTTRLLTGIDAGLRGDMSLVVDTTGTVGEAALHTHLHLSDLRRDQFVPDHPLLVDVDCLSDARNQFHAFTDIRCAWPVAGTDHALVALTGAIPDLRTPTALDLQLGATRLPVNTLLSWLRIASRRIPPDLAATGYLNGTLAFNSAHPDLAQPNSAQLTPSRQLGTSTAPHSPFYSLAGQATLGPLTVTSPALGATPVLVGELTFSTDLPSSPTRLSSSANPRLRRHPEDTTSQVPGLTLRPTTLNLDGEEPAKIEAQTSAQTSAQIEAHFNRTGYRLHLTGPILPVRLLAVAQALPPFGEGLDTLLAPSGPATPFPLTNAAAPAPLPLATTQIPSATTLTRLDLTATRAWGGPQTWTDNTRSPSLTKPPKPPHRKRRTEPKPQVSANQHK